MDICIFPGTFNPIHRAHLSMAEFILKNYNFDKIIFVPSYIPPHKELDKSMAEHRFNMVKLAISGNKKFGISDVEYKSNGTSYSLITVQKIKNEYSVKGRLNFIIGTDAFLNVKSWYKADELKELVHFLVFPRGDDSIINEEFDGYSYELVDAPKSDISSTELRNEHYELTTNKVKDYIKKYELYN
ncbi:nicotinate (nicotinamide) nucleotide adenylyltransferase [bacterium]|nr:nicotinate (nicotinamide) nucleotide adenylyltransferase [bacterium]